MSNNKTIEATIIVSTSNNDLIMAKCTALVCMLLSTLLAGSLPHLLNYHFRWTKKMDNLRSSLTVQCLLHFGGGVLLATVLIHLLPEVQDIVEHLQHCTQTLPEFKFHLPELLMCLGFIIMYFIDEAMHALIKCRYLQNKHKHKDNTIIDDNRSLQMGTSISTLVDTEKSYNNIDNLYNNNNNNSNNSNNSNNKQRQQQQQQHHEHNDCELPIVTEFTTATIPFHNHCHSISGNSDSPNTGHGINKSSLSITSSFRGLLIVLSLSLHEIFEGLAIGLEDDISSVWFLFAAVSAHKLILSFCVGVELLVARTRLTLIIIYSVTFAVVSPIGIAVGILVTHNSTFGADNLVAVILQGFACGTLLYVLFFEILSRKENHHNGLITFAATFIGFCVMFGIQQLGDHNHEYDHSGNSTCLHGGQSHKHYT